MIFVFPPHERAALAVYGENRRFPIHHIYCIGRNYAEHAKEMGADINRTEPVFFTKPADAVVPEGGEIPYPSATRTLHHEIEMVVALSAGGRDIPLDHALDCVYGYGVGLDLTRRDLQTHAKAKSLPWDAAKGFDHSAPVSALRQVNEIGHPAHLRMTLTVNNELRQQTDISEMIFSVPAIIHELSKLFELKSGDLIFTGTPAGVAALVRGDRFRAELERVAVLEGEIV